MLMNPPVKAPGWRSSDKFGENGKLINDNDLFAELYNFIFYLFRPNYAVPVEVVRILTSDFEDKFTLDSLCHDSRE